jgi:hypothetical protein
MLGKYMDQSRLKGGALPTQLDAEADDYLHWVANS